jgi:hypothetical protein
MWGNIGPIIAPGWDYVWAMHKPSVDANNWLITNPVGVYVAKVYRDGDFSTLLIGP